MPHQPAAPKPTMTSSYPASDAWSTARRIAFELVMSWIMNVTGCSSSCGASFRCIIRTPSPCRSAAVLSCSTVRTESDWNGSSDVSPVQRSSGGSLASLALVQF